MTIVEGQIESLKRIKHLLTENGINRFNSIGEINSFLKNYDSERHEIFKHTAHALDIEIEDLQNNIIKLQQTYDNLKIEVSNKLNNKVKILQDKYDQVKTKNTKNFIIKLFYSLQFTILDLKKTYLQNNFEKTIHQKSKDAENEVIKTNNKIDEYTINKEKIILKRCKPKYEELAFTKEVVEGLNTLIIGAIGENLVVNELKELSDKYILFNDYSIEFYTPIYNKKENDRIYSIQIDHLLVTNSGIFILETKNWSKKSLENLDLRSPVKQIMRTSYALFVLLNSDSNYNEIDLNSHHWGKKQIPIRNVVVMINEKPKENFKYVKVLSLKELNRYITYFDPIFNDDEVKSISDNLRIYKD